MPQDDAKRYEKDVQEVHDKAVKEVDAKVLLHLYKTKLKSVQEV